MDVRLLVAVLISGFFAANATAQDVNKNETVAIEKMTISQIMKTAHKKPNDLLKKVATGKASQKEKQDLLKMYKILASRKPTKGKSESWKNKTTLLVKAAEAANKGTKDYNKMLYRASNCMSCHKEHKSVTASKK